MTISNKIYSRLAPILPKTTFRGYLKSAFLVYHLTNKLLNLKGLYFCFPVRTYESFAFVNYLFIIHIKRWITETFEKSTETLQKKEKMRMYFRNQSIMYTWWYKHNFCD